MDTLPKIKKKEIEKSFNDAWDFLFVFIDKYHKIMDQDATGEIWKSFNDAQFALLTYNILDAEVNNGGFIQLIFNGYGYIFESSFSETIKTWGAIKTAEILEEAKVLYDKYKDEIIAARSPDPTEEAMEKFSQLYSKFKDFEALDDKFYTDDVAQETENIKKYIENNLDEFCVVV